MQKLAEEKKAEALKHMNSMPQELDLKRHGPDGYGGGGHGCRPDPRTASMPRQHPKQVGRQLLILKWYSYMEVLVEILDSTYLLSYFASSSLKTSAQKSIEYLL